MKTAIQTVAFHGAQIPTIKQDGIEYVSVRPICDHMGVGWASQRKRIMRDDVLNSVVELMRAQSPILRVV